MGSQISVLNGAIRMANRLAKIRPEEFQRVVAETTFQAQGEIVADVTRKGLVDTGFYRAGWQASLPGPMQGKVATNVEYALALEYGFDGEVTVPSHQRKSSTGKVYTVRSHTRKMKMKPQYVARDTARKMRRVFKERMVAALRGMLA